MPSPRMTSQRIAIASAIGGEPGFVSAQELHEKLADAGSKIGLATVYRTLSAMSDDGELDVLRTDTETLYRRCGTDTHHHHLVCRQCGKTIEVQGETVERWAQKIAADAGFSQISHTVELTGLCSNCAITISM